MADKNAEYERLYDSRFKVNTDADDYYKAYDKAQLESFGLHDVKVDKINSPPHYLQGTIEAIDYLKSNMPVEAYIGGLEWNVKKYMHRWRYKGTPVEDLKKAQWYLNKLIETHSGE